MRHLLFAAAFAAALLIGNGAFAQVRSHSGVVRLLHGPTEADTWAVSFSRHYRHLQEDAPVDVLPADGRRESKSGVRGAAHSQPPALPENVAPSYQHPEEPQAPPQPAPGRNAAPACPAAEAFPPAPSHGVANEGSCSKFSCCSAITNKQCACYSTFKLFSHSTNSCACPPSCCQPPGAVSSPCGATGCAQSCPCGHGCCEAAKCCGHAPHRPKRVLLKLFCWLRHKCSHGAPACQHCHCGAAAGCQACVGHGGVNPPPSLPSTPVHDTREPAPVPPAPTESQDGTSV